MSRHGEDKVKKSPKTSDSAEENVSLCIGCGRNNPYGLKLTPGRFYQSWPKIVHGGIISTMLDEAMGHATLFSGFFHFLTAAIQVSFKRPVPVGEPLVITASVTSKKERKLEVEGKVTLRDGTLLAEGRATQVLMNKSHRLEAVIWDMDGIIADTGPYHLMAWQEVFPQRGMHYSDEDFRRNFGKRNDTIIRIVTEGKLSDDEVNAIAREKEAIYRQKVAPNLKPLPGVLEKLATLHEYGVRIALASSAPIENVDLVIDNLNIRECFEVIVWGREVTEGKPSPQGFLLAAERLGVEPANCLVIEDSIAGVTAARRAGMKCLAVTNTHPRSKLTEADIVVDSLEKVTIADLIGLF
jgi:beta-phosphoglucomutase family hydrolase